MRRAEWWCGGFGPRERRSRKPVPVGARGRWLETVAGEWRLGAGEPEQRKRVGRGRRKGEVEALWRQGRSQDAEMEAEEESLSGEGHVEAEKGSWEVEALQWKTRRWSQTRSGVTACTRAYTIRTSSTISLILCLPLRPVRRQGPSHHRHPLMSAPTHQSFIPTPVAFLVKS